MSETPPEQPPKNRTTDYLANERTFLAWMRTALAAISLGFVIARFSVWLHEIATVSGSESVPESGQSLPIGLGLILFGALTAVLSVIRFRIVNKQISTGGAHPSSLMILFTAAGVLILAAVLIANLLLITSGW